MWHGKCITMLSYKLHMVAGMMGKAGVIGGETDLALCSQYLSHRGDCWLLEYQYRVIGSWGSLKNESCPRGLAGVLFSS